MYSCIISRCVCIARKKGHSAAASRQIRISGVSSASNTLVSTETAQRERYPLPVPVNQERAVSVSEVEQSLSTPTNTRESPSDHETAEYLSLTDSLQTVIKANPAYNSTLSINSTINRGLHLPDRYSLTYDYPSVTTFVSSNERISGSYEN